MIICGKAAKAIKSYLDVITSISTFYFNLGFCSIHPFFVHVQKKLSKINIGLCLCVCVCVCVSVFKRR